MNTASSTLDSLDAVQQATVELTMSARRELHLYSPDLEPRLYDYPPFLSALRALAVSGGRAARIHILVRDSAPAVSRGHRLIELARQLTSFIEIRRLAEDSRERLDAFLVVDRRAVVHRLHWTSYQGTASPDDPVLARALVKEFDALWETASSDPELRRLHL
ncbi:MAG: hypothetical protein J5I81_09035 [Nitrococcus mobilis]|nr:hypothetical protein [Nitrococcus mobilis]